MNKTLIILKHEFSRTLSRRSFILMTLAFPLLALLAIVGYQATQGLWQPSAPETTTIGYVDQAGGFDDYTSQQDVILVLQPGEDEATEALLEGEISQYFVIPQDYLSTGLVYRYTLEREVEPPGKVKQVIRNFLIGNLLADETDSLVVERAQYPLSLNSITLDESGQIAEEQGGFAAFIVPYIFSFLLIMAIFTSSGFLMQGLGEEKENRIMEILLSSVSPRQLITGKVLGLGAAGLLQVIVWLISARFLAGMASSTIGGMLSSLQIPTDFLIISLVYFILGYFLFAIIMAGAGSIGASARESQQLSVIFTLMAVSPLWFAYLITSNPNHALVQFLTMFPFTAPVTVMLRMGLTDIPAWQLVVSIGLMIVTIVGLLWLVAKVFRTFLLMYGKTPRLGEIVRYLRQA
ncbi:MAG TPA: ABC transporter permease [Dehalococcoidia bacterium]|nr:ABC transporter permease [Dehalococcoidia bacterium]